MKECGDMRLHWECLSMANKLDMRKILLEVGVANTLVDLLGKERFHAYYNSGDSKLIRYDYKHLSVISQQVIAAIEVGLLTSVELSLDDLSELLHARRSDIQYRMNYEFVTSHWISTRYNSAKKHVYVFTELASDTRNKLKDYWRDAANTPRYKHYFQNLLRFLNLGAHYSLCQASSGKS